MKCPVCGQADAGDVCGRCGTDLRALLGSGRSPELQIRPAAERPDGDRPRRSST